MLFLEATLPALVLVLVVVAAMERLLRWAFGIKRSGRSIAAVGFEELNAVYQGTNRRELEQREVEQSRRDDESQGAPPGRIDFTTGTITLSPPHSAQTAWLRSAFAAKHPFADRLGIS